MTFFVLILTRFTIQKWKHRRKLPPFFNFIWLFHLFAFHDGEGRQLSRASMGIILENNLVGKKSESTGKGEKKEIKDRSKEEGGEINQKPSTT